MSKIMNEGFPIQFKINYPDSNSKKTIYITFYINDETYCTGGYMIETDLSRKCFIPSLYSNIGNRSGSFLLQLQVLLAISTNCKEITLDNFTDNPARAASKSGVYGIFHIDKRGSDRSDFIGATTEEKLLASEGQMRFIIDSNSKNIWVEEMKNFASHVDDTKDPWNTDLEKHINMFIYNINQYEGGKAKKTKKAKKSKKTKKTNKTKKTRKSKK